MCDKFVAADFRTLKSTFPSELIDSPDVGCYAII